MASELETSLSGERIGRLLYRRDLAMIRHRAALARSLALTDSEMLAILHLAQHGELAPSTIGALLDLSSGGATALVQRLERGDHVRRRPHPSDRRSTLIQLTPATTRRLKEADARLLDGLERLAADLGDREQVVVANFLTKVADLSESLSRPARREAPPGAGDPMTRPVPSLWA